MPPTDTIDLRAKRAEMLNEHNKGQSRLQALRAELDRVQTVSLRIEGAIAVLDEVIQAQEAAALLEAMPTLVSETPPDNVLPFAPILGDTSGPNIDVPSD